MTHGSTNMICDAGVADTSKYSTSVRLALSDKQNNRVLQHGNRPYGPTQDNPS